MKATCIKMIFCIFHCTCRITDPKRLRLVEHQLKALQEEMKVMKEDLRNIRKKVKRRDSEAEKHVKTTNVKTTSSASVAPSLAAAPSKPAAAEAELPCTTAPPIQESHDNGNTAVPTDVPDIGKLRKEVSQIADSRLSYIVKFVALKIFTTEELLNCSISGKKSVKSVNARAPLSQKKLDMFKTLINEKVPDAQWKDIREKFQNVQKVIRKQ